MSALEKMAYFGLYVLMFGVILQVLTGISARLFVYAGFACCVPLYIFAFFYYLGA